MSGKLAKDDGAFNVIADKLWPLNVALPKQPSLDEPLEYSPYKFLKTLRRHAPAVKSWG